jgi:hypothetical protein
MAKKLTFILTVAVCMSFAAFVSAQTCADIHGASGCAPSPNDGEEVTVTGIVYVVAGTYNNGSVYFQCPGDTGGLTFFDTAAQGVIDEGDLIEVTGDVGSFGDEIQLENAVWNVTDVDNWAVPNAIGTNALASGGNFLGDFMRTEGILTLVSAGFNSIYEVDDGTGPVTVFVDGTTGIDTARIDQWLGDWVCVMGSTKCYDSIGEILPRRDTDICLVSVPVETVTWGGLKAMY